ncbi:hypothetical protein AWW66_19410 [Micromonospora rosaria]|uniref:RNase H type-1 domain-containing protein n=1 Tax=Micromonospora rosaria TaxID=47874 RepID=A0A136PPF9_9ACTN|nr:RNase H family protein [Micromonospora rosaria]KXK60343.1 hypothetical protein AWW66_19410 [Micromonospora rosaria]
MRADEFDEAVHLLPPDLYQRALPLRPYLPRTRCEQCVRIADSVELALLAARYEEARASAQLIAAAEELAAGHRHDTGDQVARAGPGRGLVARWAGVPAGLVAATDASWKRRAGGIGYVVSDGRYGLRGRRRDRLDPTGPSQVLVNELRAVEYLLSDGVPPVGLTVLVDSLPALRLLHRWQRGDVTAVPAGYSLRPRRHGGPPTLVRLARLVATRPELSFQHVRAHTGHALNEAADGLSHLARRSVEEQFNPRTRAYDLVDAFLRDWHAAVPV